MYQSSDESAARVGRTLEHEMNLVRDAIAMVASGRSRRVIVGGIRLGEALLAPAMGMASEAGVRLVPLWTTDEAGVDIAIERIAE